jgi:phosphatidylglycerophosphatase C
MTQQNLALFDFDNTLSICDSFLPFTLFVAGPSSFSKALWSLLERRLQGPIGRKEAKEIIAKGTLRNRTVAEIQARAEEFQRFFFRLAMNELLLAELRKHLRLGDRVIIVSASPRLLISTFAENLGTEALATELVESEGVLTGEILGENCRAEEKVRRISAILDLKNYPQIAAYGDSSGDTEMLRVATKAVYRGGRDPLYHVTRTLKAIVLYTFCVLKSL